MSDNERTEHAKGQEHLNGETVKLLRQLADDLEAGRITVLHVQVDDRWGDDLQRGRPHKILAEGKEGRNASMEFIKISRYLDMLDRLKKLPGSLLQTP